MVWSRTDASHNAMSTSWAECGSRLGTRASTVYENTYSSYHNKNYVALSFACLSPMNGVIHAAVYANSSDNSRSIKGICVSQHLSNSMSNHTHTRAHARTHAHTHTRTRTRKHTPTHTHAHTRIRAHTHTRTQAHTHARAHHARTALS